MSTNTTHKQQHHMEASDHSEPNFKAFSKILNFMRELKEAFGTEFPQVVKYYSLCKKTGLDKHNLLNKHIKIFGNYCVDNSEAIHTSDLSLLNHDDIAFNDKIGFNLKQIVLKADADSAKVIVKHLQIILCLIHPDDKLKTSLTLAKKEQDEKDDTGAALNQIFPNLGGKEGDLFSGLLNKLRTRYDGKDMNNLNLGEIMSDLTNGGVLQEITDSVQNGLASGDLNLNSLMSGAMGIFDQMKGDQSNPQIAGMLGMLKPMMEQMSMANMDHTAN